MTPDRPAPILRKFLNDPDAFADEALDGLVLASAGRMRRLAEEPRAVVGREGSTAGRVAIATGGGSGHLPLFAGYVGKGLVDGCAVGNMFASPSTDVMLAVTRAIDSGHGVLYVYGNYGGDRINFEAAAEFAGDEDIAVRTVRAADDVLSAPADRASTRRGIAGIWFGYAVAAHAVWSGLDLDAAAALTQRAMDRTRSAGVALSGPILPTVGAPNFELDADELEIGTGIHGEPGVRRGPMLGADALVDELLTPLVEELRLSSGDEVAVLVNGLGATPLEELYILYRRVHHVLVEAGIRIRSALVGEYATSLEMAGASISLLHLDDELAAAVETVAGEIA